MTALVQTAIGNTAGGASADVSATFASTPTPGNLMVAVLTVAAITVPSGTTPWSGKAADVSSIAPASVRTYIFSKVAGASEPATVSATLAASATTHRINLYEFSPTAGLAWAGVDKTAAAQDVGATVTTLSSGTAAATVAGDGVAVSGISLSATSAGFALTNGYTVLQNPAASPSGFSGHLIYTGSATQETTASWTTARRAAAAIATYRQALPGSGSFLALL